MTLLERFERAGIDLTIDRVSNNYPHHPKSIQLIQDLSDLINLDLEWLNGFYCWKICGDNEDNNRDILMYQMDLLMELNDFEQTLS